MTLTPFHGDEATQIFMSRDYAYQFIQRDLTLVTYHDPPISAQEQELRLLNGTVNKYLIGAAWHVSGFSVNDLNQQWDWGAGWDYNHTTGHAPTAALLNLARLPSALLLAFGLIPLYAITRAGGGRGAALLACALYALHPALLINGRRAMMEGGMTAFVLLTAAAGIGWLRAQERGGRVWGWALLLGAAGGVALASKHTALFVVAPVYAALTILMILNRRGRKERREIIESFSLRALRSLRFIVFSCLAAGAVFYALNPAWWGDPLARVGMVLRLRADLLAGQTAAFGGYASFSEQIGGGLRQLFGGAAQYYEVSGWDVYLADQIALYEASLWRGAALPSLLFAVLMLAGIVALLRARGAARWLILTWAFGAVGAALLLTPIEWGRYYVIAYPPLIALTGIGTAWLIRAAWNSRARFGARRTTGDARLNEDE